MEWGIHGLKSRKDCRNTYKARFKKLYSLFGSCFVLLAVFFAWFDVDSWIVGLTYLIVTIVFLTGIRYELVRCVGYIDKLLGRMMDEKTINEEELVYYDDLSSKLAHKIWKINNLYTNKKDILESEKEEIESLISDIAHQVKTPMTNIKMYHEMLTEQLPENQEEKKMAIIVQSQIDKLEFLIQSMLKISEFESGIIALNSVPTTVQACIMNALENSLLSAQKKAITIKVHEGMTSTIYGDIKWTSEALFNILDNAIKYTHKGGRIDITADEMQAYTRIGIKDNGIGIHKENLTNVFKRFYREDNGGISDGVGIGLNLSREIVMKQGGYIAVESEKNKGSSFYVFMPKSK